jgi:hypothetical protein
MPSQSGAAVPAENPAAAAHRMLETLSDSIPAENSATSTTSGAWTAARSVAVPNPRRHRRGSTTYARPMAGPGSTASMIGPAGVSVYRHHRSYTSPPILATGTPDLSNATHEWLRRTRRPRKVSPMPEPRSPSSRAGHSGPPNRRRTSGWRNQGCTSGNRSTVKECSQTWGGAVMRWRVGLRGRGKQTADRNAPLPGPGGFAPQPSTVKVVRVRDLCGPSAKSTGRLPSADPGGVRTLSRATPRPRRGATGPR